MTNDKHDKIKNQTEELQDADLDQAQGGFKVEIEGVKQDLRPRLTNAESASIRKYEDSADFDKVIKPGTKIRGPGGDPG